MPFALAAYVAQVAFGGSQTYSDQKAVLIRFMSSVIFVMIRVVAGWDAVAGRTGG